MFGALDQAAADGSPVLILPKVPADSRCRNAWLLTQDEPLPLHRDCIQYVILLTPPTRRLVNIQVSSEACVLEGASESGVDCEKQDRQNCIRPLLGGEYSGGKAVPRKSHESEVKNTA